MITQIVEMLFATYRRLPNFSVKQYFWFGFLIVFAMLSYLEWMQPFYFSQDDSHRQYLPILIRGVEGFMATGQLPLWDAYSGFGMVILNGGYPFFYLPFYLAYFIAVALGDVTMLIEVFAYIHLLAAYAVMFAALYRIGAFPFIVMCAAACYAFTGYNLVQGRSWINVLGIPVYMAGFVYLLSYCAQGFKLDRRWGRLFALNIVGFYYMGHQQFWFYGLLTFAMGYAWSLISPGITRWRDILFVASYGVLALACCAPLMWPQWIEQKYVLPMHIYNDYGISGMTRYLFTPLVDQPYHALFFGGAVYVAAAGLLLLSFGESLLHRTRQWMSAGVYLVPALFAFLMLYGDGGLLWPEMKNWPIWNKFRYIHKWVPYMNAFAYAAAIIVLGRIYRAGRAGKVLSSFCSILAVGLSIYNAAHCTQVVSFMSDRPFPTLPPVLQNVQVVQHNGVSPYRVASLGFMRSYDQNFTLRLNNNYSSYYSIFSANRYNQRVTTTPEIYGAINLSRDDPEMFLRRYSIGWVLDAISAGGDNDLWPDLAMHRLAEAKKSLEISQTSLKEIPATLYMLDPNKVDPLVFARFSSRPDLPEKLRFDVLPNGLRIHLQNLTARDQYIPYEVVASFLDHSSFRAYGYPGAKPLDIGPDKYSRMVMTIDRSLDYIMLIVDPDWLTGWLLLLCGVVLAFMMRWLASLQIRSRA